jgi:hypothetical protein
LLIRILGLVEQEVRGQFFVLVAGEICLDNQVALEAKSAQLRMLEHDYFEMKGR